MDARGTPAATRASVTERALFLDLIKVSGVGPKLALKALSGMRHQEFAGALEAGEVAGMALGSLLMTVLIHVVGLRNGLALIGVVVTLAVLPGLPAMRRIDKTTFTVGVTHRPASAHSHLHFHHHRL